MRAIVLDHAHSLRYIETYPVPKRAQDEALLKIRLAGICNTDLEIIDGYREFEGVLGHEFVGDVIEGPFDWVGQRVVGEINVACQRCDLCSRGIPSQCRHRTTVGINHHEGAFADQLALVMRNLHRVPDTVTDEEAVFTEPLAAALNVLELVQISPRAKVVVIGAGKLGLLAAQVVRLTGANVCVVVRREKPAALLKKWQIPAVSIEDLIPQSFDTVIDCTGNAEGFASAIDLVEPRGTVVLKSTYYGVPKTDLSKVTVNEIRVIGSRCGSFPAALRLLELGLIDVKPLIETRFPINYAIEAFEASGKPGALKMLIDF